jgi:hypothetical protein
VNPRGPPVRPRDRASATATPTSAKDTTMSNHAPARHRAEAAASTFRRRQRRPEALGRARYAIRYLIAFGSFRALSREGRPWHGGQWGTNGERRASSGRAA